MGAPAATTKVTLLLSSTANDRLSRFNLTFTALTLSNQSGNTVTLLAKPQNAEFMHLNGGVESLLTADVPQDLYTSASASIGAANFECIALDSSGGILSGSYAYGSTPTGNVTVNLPQPITVANAHIGLVLNLQVAQSEVFSTCDSASGQPYTIEPNFNLTALTFAAQPTNIENGIETNLGGLISSVSSDGGGFNVASADGPTWSVATNAGTLFQGIADATALSAGLPVDMDAAIQADGTLLATRVSVLGTNTPDLTAWRGPLLFVSDAEPALDALPIQVQGQLFKSGSASAATGSAGGEVLGAWILAFGSAAFQTSPQFANLGSLPFHAEFNGATMVAGQNVYISTNAPNFPNSPNYVPADTITLMPQTVNATINGVSTQGGFTVYTATLADYDLFHSLAQQPGQTTVLQNPGSVLVYVDSGTQMLNTHAVAAGSLLRFNGLVFNDNGTLRMVCREVMDGVAL